MINLHADNNLDKTEPRCCFIYICKMYVYIYVISYIENWYKADNFCKGRHQYKSYILY